MDLQPTVPELPAFPLTSVEKIEQLRADLPTILEHLDPSMKPLAAFARPLLEPYLQRFCSQGPTSVDEQLQRIAAMILQLVSHPGSERPQVDVATVIGW